MKRALMTIRVAAGQKISQLYLSGWGLAGPWREGSSLGLHEESLAVTMVLHSATAQLAPNQKT